MKAAYDVIQSVMVTEKSAELAAQKKYLFKVDPRAEKIEIGRAVEALFPDVKVKSVNVMNYDGKLKRVGRSPKVGRRPNWKKAVITLAEGTINVL